MIKLIILSILAVTVVNVNGQGGFLGLSSRTQAISPSAGELTTVTANAPKKGVFGKIGSRIGGLGKTAGNFVAQRGITWGAGFALRTLGMSGGVYTMVPMLAYPLLKPMLRPFSHFGRRVVTAVFKTKCNLFGFIFNIPKMLLKMIGNVFKQIRYAAIRNNIGPFALLKAKKSLLKLDAVNIPSAPLQTQATRAVPGLGALASLGINGQKVLDSKTTQTTSLRPETGGDLYNQMAPISTNQFFG